MSAAPLPLVVLPGAGGDPPDRALFCAEASDRERVMALRYPGWRAYVDPGLTGEGLIDLLSAEIAERFPQTPVVLLGFSIGGHFAYAAALRLESLGRRVSGLCIIDSGIITAGRSRHWKARMVSRLAGVIRRGRPGALAAHVRQLAWRALFRLAGDRLPALARGLAGPLRRIERIDPAFAEELSMRLLIRITAGWMRSLDDHPARLRAPAVLLRTEATASGEDLWRRRCPDLRIIDLPGNHDTLLEGENAAALRSAFLAATAGWGDPARA